MGGGRPLQSLPGGEEEPQPWARASHCALRRRPASCEASFLLSALQALSRALPASLREDRETGLGEVERFIPGEQAGEKGGAVRAVTPIPVQASPGPHGGGHRARVHGDSCSLAFHLLPGHGPSEDA